MLFQKLKKIIILIGCLLSFGTSYSQLNVWPGDANNNGEVSHLDLLYLGATHGFIGPARDSISNLWIGHSSPGWFNFLNVIDAAFADCNGDGMVFDDDVLAIEQNFGLTHGPILPDTFNTVSYTDTVNAVFDIMNDFGPITEVQADSIYTIDLNLGDVTDSLTDFYGIAFTVVFNESWCQPVNFGADFFEMNGSWIANDPNTEILKVENWDGVNRLRVAMTKKDGFNTSGYGKIGDFYIVIEGNVPTDVSNEPIMRIEDVYIVDELLNIKQWVEGELKVDILSATEELSKSKLRIYPNPSSTGTVVVEGLPSNEIDSIEFYDALGRGIPISIKEKEIKFQGDFTGVAFLRVNTKEGFITQRIIITR